MTSKNTKIFDLYVEHKKTSGINESSTKIPYTRKTISERKKPKENDLGNERVNILVLVKTCIVKVGEPIELNFSVYNNSSGLNNGFITENFVVNLNQLGMPDDHDYIDRMYSIFSDLSEQEISNSDLYLVCNIIRNGKLNFEKGKSGKVNYRRPFAGAVLKLTKDLLQEKPKDAVMDIFSFSEKNMSNFFELHKAIIEQRPEIQKVPLSQGFFFPHFFLNQID